VLANNRPAVSTDAHDHGGRGPRRSDAARAATPIASTASATPDPAGATGPNIGSKRCAHAINSAAARAATARNRRSQPRTVEAGRPTSSAALPYPPPAAAQRNAAPITATVSTRRANTTSGNNTCVDPHERHRARRGRNATGPDSDRNTRHRANPHRPNTPPHDGHLTTPDAKSLSTSSGSLLTINTMPLRHHPEDPLVIPAKERRGGPYANRTS
jgi:hypothetical protein